MKLSFAYAILLVFLSSAISAEDKQPRVWSLQLENDVFSQFMGLRDSDSEASGFDGDKDYTQGLRIGLSFRDKKDLPFYKFLRALPMIGNVKERNGKLSLTYQIFMGQNIYTPTAIDVAELQVNDRPYAGWLYLGSNITRQNGRDLESIELDIGVIGPLSGARQVQSTWHDIIDTRTPLGWDNQLKNEPAFSLFYTRARNVPLMKGEDHNGYGIDFTPHGTIAVGTVYTHLGLGGTLRLGSGLNRELMTPNRVQPSMPGSDYFDTASSWSFYGFIGAEVRAIARNVFLDGNLFRDSHRIAKEHFVGEISLGFVGFTDKWRFAYTHVFRTDEFVGQTSGHYFGSFSVGRVF